MTLRRRAAIHASREAQRDHSTSDDAPTCSQVGVVAEPLAFPP